MIAQKLGKYRGKNVFLFTVNVSCNEIVTFTLNPNHAKRFSVQVISDSAGNALNYVRDLIDWPACTEFVTQGSKGGTYNRFIGYDSFVWRELSKPDSKQEVFQSILDQSFDLARRQEAIQANL